MVLPPYETGPAPAPPSAPIILSVKWVQALKTGGSPWSCRHLQDLNSSGTENSGVPCIMLFWLCVRELICSALLSNGNELPSEAAPAYPPPLLFHP